MIDTRRGFLKTLGKLAAAVGLTAAVASIPAKAPESTAPKAKDLTYKTASISPPEKWKYGFTRFKRYPSTEVDKCHFREPIVYYSNVCLVSPRDSAILKDIETTPLSYELLEETYKQAVQGPGQYMYAGNVTVTNRKPNTLLSMEEMTSRHQEWLNRITMVRIDNISATLKPEILLKDLMPDNS